MDLGLSILLLTNDHFPSLVFFLSILTTTTLIEEYREVRRLKRRARNNKMTLPKKIGPSINPVVRHDDEEQTTQTDNDDISQIQEASLSSAEEKNHLCPLLADSYGTIAIENRKEEDVLSEASVDEYEEGYFSLYDCDDETYYKSNEIPG